MDISGLIQSYDSRATTSAALTRTIITPQYMPGHQYSAAAPLNLVATHQQLQHDAFAFGSYSGASASGMVPAFTKTYIEQRPLPRLMQPDTDASRLSFARSPRQGFVEEHLSQSPPIKPEPHWNVPHNSPSFIPNSKTIATTLSISGGNDANFGTEVDTLMKAIQAKSQTAQPQISSPVIKSRPVVGASLTPPHGQTTSSSIEMYSPGQKRQIKLMNEDLQDATSTKGGKKRYQCTIENCTKSFYQKTHLDIHERAHTGVKPYPCHAPNCNQSFSQLGNLKTHQRRHTGERPYQCEICGKRFAQRGNVRAHRIVHDQSKPYLCRLDDCGKQFTQLGNLKSHQNKFHINTIRTLTAKFASIKDGDIVPAADKELWEYFANLYKNSNKGIKGRGKDRKVENTSLRKSSRRNLSVMGRGEYNSSGSCHGGMVVGTIGHEMGVGSVVGRGDGNQYEMYDVDDESQSSSHSGGTSSVGTCYDDTPPDVFEDHGRGVDLAFGDRIY